MNLEQTFQARPAKKSGRKVRFEYYAPEASSVSLAGSFNQWNPNAAPLKKDAGGNWKTELSLAPGRYEYLFYADGNWTCDPRCKECVPNPFGSWNCTVTVR
jgi:1,4-alpha-glucan branching enzyme